MKRETVVEKGKEEWKVNRDLEEKWITKCSSVCYDYWEDYIVDTFNPRETFQFIPLLPTLKGQ